MYNYVSKDPCVLAPSDVQLFHAGMMRLWQQKKGSEATYLCLADGLESLKLRDMIIFLLDLYSEHKQAKRESVDMSREPDVPRLGNLVFILLV